MAPGPGDHRASPRAVSHWWLSEGGEQGRKEGERECSNLSIGSKSAKWRQLSDVTEASCECPGVISAKLSVQ